MLTVLGKGLKLNFEYELPGSSFDRAQQHLYQAPRIEPLKDRHEVTDHLLDLHDAHRGSPLDLIATNNKKRKNDINAQSIRVYKEIEKAIKVDFNRVNPVRKVLIGLKAMDNSGTLSLRKIIRGFETEIFEAKLANSQKLKLLNLLFKKEKKHIDFYHLNIAFSELSKLKFKDRDLAQLESFLEIGAKLIEDIESDDYFKTSLIVNILKLTRKDISEAQMKLISALANKMSKPEIYFKADNLNRIRKGMRGLNRVLTSSLMNTYFTKFLLAYSRADRRDKEEIRGVNSLLVIIKITIPFESRQNSQVQEIFKLAPLEYQANEAISRYVNQAELEAQVESKKLEFIKQDPHQMSFEAIRKVILEQQAFRPASAFDFLTNKIPEIFSCTSSQFIKVLNESEFINSLDEFMDKVWGDKA